MITGKIKGGNEFYEFSQFQEKTISNIDKSFQGLKECSKKKLQEISFPLSEQLKMLLQIDPYNFLYLSLKIDFKESSWSTKQKTTIVNDFNKRIRSRKASRNREKRRA